MQAGAISSYFGFSRQQLSAELFYCAVLYKTCHSKWIFGSDVKNQSNLVVRM